MAPSPSTVSADTLLIWEALPGYVQDSDQANGYPFLGWLEGIGSQLQAVDNIVRDDASGNPGYSILFDSTRCPTLCLPWLAQLVGVRLNPSQQTDAQMRASITAEQGFQRGTVAAIVQAASGYLSPGYSVTVLERTSDAYHYTVQVPTAGLTGGTWGAVVALYPTWTALEAAFATWTAVDEQDAAIQSALNAANPGGLIMTMTLV